MTARTFEGKYERMTRVYFRPNMGYFPAYVGFDDVVQEGFLIFAKLDAAHPEWSEDHFSAAFLRSLMNFARLRTTRLRRDTVISETSMVSADASADDSQDFLDNLGGFTKPDEYELVLNDMTPDELQAIRTLEGQNFELKRRKTRNTNRLEDASEALARLTGVVIPKTRLEQLLIG